MCSVHQAQHWDLLESYLKATLSLEHNRQTCLVHKQINRDYASRATVNSDRSATSGRVAQTGRKTTRMPRRVGNQKEQPRQRGHTDKLDYTSRFVRVIPTFSQHCHETVTLLNKSRCCRCKYGCERMFISTPRLKTAVARRDVLSTKL